MKYGDSIYITLTDGLHNITGSRQQKHSLELNSIVEYN